MSSTTTDALVLHLNHATVQMNRYASIIIYLFGSFGNIFNILVLSQRTFRSNSCAFLFLLSSMASLVAILAGFTSRILSAWIPDLTNTIDWICQMRAFVLFLARMIAMWMITLATVDRWLLSSPKIHRRRLSSLKNARRASIVLFLVAFLLNTPIIVCNSANLTDTPQKCYGKTNFCRITTDLIYGCVSILIPCLVMFAFAFLIIRNIRQSRSTVRAAPVSQTNQSMETASNQTNKTKKKDRQLLFMLLIQVLFLIVLTSPQAVQKLYATITLKISSASKSPLENALENFIFNLVILLTYFASGLPFYLYTLTGGRVFRDGCRSCLRSLTCR